MPRMPPCWPLEQLRELRPGRCPAPGCARRCGRRPARRSRKTSRRLQVAELAASSPSCGSAGCHAGFAVAVASRLALPTQASTVAAGGFDRRACAPLVAPMPLSVTPSFELARQDDLGALCACSRTRPALLQRQQVDVGRLRRLRRSPGALRRCHLRVSDLKPRLGRRRCSGIWPPSKPTLWKPPERATSGPCGRGPRSCPGRSRCRGRRGACPAWRQRRA